MKKLIFILKVAALLTVFNGSATHAKAQYSDSFEVPDSLFDLMAEMDSIYDSWDEDDSASQTMSTLCPNRCNCKKKYNYTPQTDETLFHLDHRYALIYEDNFDDINTAFWNVIDNCGEECWYDPDINCDADWRGRYDAGDRQWLQKENVRIQKGTDGTSTVAIDLKRDPGVRPWPNYPGPPISKYYEFTSGFLKSKKALPYGTCFIEARIKLPQDIKDARMNPAFWLFGYGSHNTELDIFEFFDSDKKMSTSLHSGGSRCAESKTVSNSFFEDWHIYRCYWNKAFIAVQVDRKNWTIARNHVVSSKYGTQDRKDATIHLEEDEEVEMREVYPNKGMRMLFNLQIEKCDNRRETGVSFPQTMEMDWLRIWYRLPCNEDLVINDINQIPQVVDEINILAGKDITCNVNTALNSNVYLKVIHTGTFTGNQLIAGSNGFVEIVPTAPFDCSQQGPTSHNSKTDFQLPQHSVAETNYEVFPNPAGNEIIVQSKTLSELNLSMSISNLANVLVKRTQINSNTNSLLIDISMLSDGIYFIELLDDQGNKETKKLVVCKN